MIFISLQFADISASVVNEFLSVFDTGGIVVQTLKRLQQTNKYMKKEKIRETQHVNDNVYLLFL